MTYITFIGLFAAACTTTAFLPQVVKAIKTKETKDISIVMYLILIAGLLSWLTYGILLADIPLIAANVATLILAVWVFVLKIKYG